MNKSDVILVFVKAPRLGNVKTRLQPHLSKRESLRLYRAMVKDLLSQFKASENFDTRIFYWPPDADLEISGWLGDHYHRQAQTGADLGERMHQAFVTAFDENFQRVLIVGSDLPTLDVNAIDKAFAELVWHDVVLGPCGDGGYYLIGLKQPQPKLFQEISWSTESVLTETLHVCQQNKLSVALLNKRWDLDTYEDAKRTWDLLNRQTDEKIRGVSETHRVLNDIFSDDS